MQTFGELQRTFPSIYFVWNNVIKIGKVGKGTLSDTMIEWQRNWFEVIKKEIDCLQPTMMFFFSGPHYDNFIRKSLGEFQIEKIGEEPGRQIAKLNFVDYPHIQAYRTYHPIYLRRSHLMKAYMQIVNDAIRQKIQVI